MSMASAKDVARIVDAAAAAVPDAAAGASRDSGVGTEALGDLLDAALRAASRDGQLSDVALARFERRGADAATAGIRLPALIDLYLSACWRLVEAAGEAASNAEALAQVARAVAHAADDAVAALTRGFDAAQRTTIRRDEARRREFVDDLLSGAADASLLAEHASAFGFSLAAPHVVVVATTSHSLEDAGPVQSRIERDVLTQLASADAIVATKEGALVCVVPSGQTDVAAALLRLLGDAEPGPWRVATGPSGSGPGGVAASYAEASRAVEFAERLRLPEGVIDVPALAGVRLLDRDPQAFRDLTMRIRARLDAARGGAQPLFQTLEAYFDTGGNTTETARRLHLSPRAVTYRLVAVERVTGLDPRRSPGRLTLEIATIGARLGID
jgi:hypothetical protein